MHDTHSTELTTKSDPRSSVVRARWTPPQARATPPLSRTSPAFSRRGTCSPPAGLPRFGSGSWERVSPVLSGEGTGFGAERSTAALAARACAKSSCKTPVEEQLHVIGPAGPVIEGSRVQQRGMRAGHDRGRQQGTMQPRRRALQWTEGDLPLTPRSPVPNQRRPVIASPQQPQRPGPSDSAAGEESGEERAGCHAPVYLYIQGRT